MYNIDMKILVVDDELPIRELIKYNLQKEGFSVITVEDGTSAIKIAKEEKPDLIVLDLMLPGMAGFDVCRVLRNDSRTEKIPIIMATAKTEDSDIISGLELGADDYITKPFSPKILVARVNSVLRRVKDKKTTSHITDNSFNNASVYIHGIRIDPDKFEVSYNDVPIILSATEFAILLLFARNPGRVFPRQKIIKDIKGESYPVTERSIDVQILNIRKKLVEATGNLALQRLIETVRGVGYRMPEELHFQDD